MDRNDKATQPVDFNQAKVVSTFKDLGRQIHENNDVVSRLTRKLQTSLDIPTIVEIFYSELNKLIKVGQFRFQCPESQTVSLGSGGGPHSCQFNLAIEDIQLGKLKVSRRKKFSEEEISIIEFLAATLVFPLKNALLYRQAVSNAMTDELTGLGNKRAMQSSLHREADRAVRYNTPIAALVVDIDYFKSINDGFGHLAGDHILKEIAKSLKATLRASDLCFRFGGEEFVVLLDESSARDARHVAERLRSQIEQTEFCWEGHPIRVTVSVGGTNFFPGETLESFLGRADKALYISKSGGRNRVTFQPDADDDKAELSTSKLAR